MRIPACVPFMAFVALWAGSTIWPRPAGAEQPAVAASEAALSAGEILVQRSSGCRAPEEAVERWM